MSPPTSPTSRGLRSTTRHQFLFPPVAPLLGAGHLPSSSKTTRLQWRWEAGSGFREFCRAVRCYADCGSICWLKPAAVIGAVLGGVGRFQLGEYLLEGKEMVIDLYLWCVFSLLVHILHAIDSWCLNQGCLVWTEYKIRLTKEK
jgi:hypothetical protein